MGEKIQPPEGLLPKSREKAQGYLHESRTLLLGRAVDVRLGLPQYPLDLAVSFSASQLQKVDLYDAKSELAKIPNYWILQRLRRLAGENIRIIELAEDYLTGRRRELLRDHFPNTSEEYVLNIRQAIQGFFVIEHGRQHMHGDEYQSALDEWASLWRNNISTTSGL